MKPVRVTVDVPYSPEQVYDFLDVTANHEPFTNHMMRDWEYSGPDRGVGSRARVKVSIGGRSEIIDIETISGERPARIVEQNTGAGGRRVASGTYMLDRLPNGHTQVSFEYRWQRAPLSERLAAPLVRAIMRRNLERSMQRLAGQLGELEPAAAE
jgi:carbon monoxide dehydrogenase subunit G